MQRLQRIILFPFLLPVFFVLHIARYFFGSVPFDSVMQMMGLYLLLSGSLYLLFRGILRNKLQAGLASFLLTGLFLYWTSTIRFLAHIIHISASFPHIPFLLLVYLLLVVTICWLVRKLEAPTQQRLTFFLNTLFLILILVELGYMAVYSIDGRHRQSLFAGESSKSSIDKTAKPGGNIYLLLFDEYASSVSLKEDWGFDNSAMDSFLKARGFFVNEGSHSNYNLTLYSMASLLNMDYLKDPGAGQNSVGRQDNQRCISAIGNARVAHVLHDAGYALKNYSIFDVAGEPRHEITDFIIDKGKLITVNTFYNILQRDYLPYLHYRARLKEDSSYPEPAFYRTDEYNEEGVRTVIREAKTGARQPEFLYAHFMMPHSDFYYDSSGSRMSAGRIRAITDAEAPRFYGYNVQHTNEKLRAMIDTIQQFDAAATIIVLGDHGYRLHNDAGPHPEHFRNMSAIYFPDRNYASIPDSLTNVNVFRVVLNKVCGTGYPLLANREFVMREAE